MNNGHVFPKVQNIVRVLLPTVLTLENAVQQWYQFSDDGGRLNLWVQGLGWARAMQGNLFLMYVSTSEFSK